MIAISYVGVAHPDETDPLWGLWLGDYFAAGVHIASFATEEQANDIAVRLAMSLRCRSWLGPKTHTAAA